MSRALRNHRILLSNLDLWEESWKLVTAQGLEDWSTTLRSLIPKYFRTVYCILLQVRFRLQKRTDLTMNNELHHQESWRKDWNHEVRALSLEDLRKKIEVGVVTRSWRLVDSGLKWWRYTLLVLCTTWCDLIGSLRSVEVGEESDIRILNSISSQFENRTCMRSKQNANWRVHPLKHSLMSLMRSEKGSGWTPCCKQRKYHHNNPEWRRCVRYGVIPSSVWSWFVWL